MKELIECPFTSEITAVSTNNQEMIAQIRALEEEAKNEEKIQAASMERFIKNRIAQGILLEKLAQSTPYGEKTKAFEATGMASQRISESRRIAVLARERPSEVSQITSTKEMRTILEEFARSKPLSPTGESGENPQTTIPNNSDVPVVITRPVPEMPHRGHHRHHSPVKLDEKDRIRHKTQRIPHPSDLVGGAGSLRIPINGKEEPRPENVDLWLGKTGKFVDEVYQWLGMVDEHKATKRDTRYAGIHRMLMEVQNLIRAMYRELMQKDWPRHHMSNHTLFQEETAQNQSN